MRPTNEQDVVAAKNKLSDLKSKYMDSIARYIAHDKNSPDQGLSELLACQKSGNEYFNYAEEFVGNSDLLGAHNNALWAQGFAEDCAEILKSMPAHFKLLLDGFSKTNSQATNYVLPDGTAYANMQRMATKYLTTSESNKLKSIFIESNLPTYGFNNQAREFMNKKLQVLLSFIFGVPFLIAMLWISFRQPVPSNFQYSVFRTVLALAGAGVVAVFPGFIEVKFGNWLRAGGVLAAFIVLYFFNPALPEAEAKASVEPKTYAPITTEALKNLSYRIENDVITLQDGKREFNPDTGQGIHEKAIFVHLTDHAFGDLDNDGTTDAIAVLQVSDGGSGIYYYLASVFNDHGSPKVVGPAYVLGDRLDFRSVSIQNGKVSAQLMMHKPEDALCCPTLFRNLEFEVKDQALQCKTAPCSEA